METSAIKEKLHRFIDNGDEKLLKMLYAVANEYLGEEDFIFTDADIEEYEKRSANRRNGKSKTYGWQGVNQMVTAK